MAKKTPRIPAKWDYVFVRNVRHPVQSKDDALYDVKKLVDAPFRFDPEEDMCGGNLAIRQKDNCDWMVAAMLMEKCAGLVALFSNAATSEELFDLNASNPRLEAIWLGCEPDGEGWFLRVNIGGKPFLDYRHAEGSKPEFVVGKPPKGFKAKKSAEDTFLWLCDFYQLKIPTRRIASDGNEIRVFGLKGTPIKANVYEHVVYQGPRRKSKRLDASRALEKAINKRDAAGIRKAIQAGAPLELLQESAATPLQRALWDIEKPRGKECAEILVNAGCDVNSNSDGTPLLNSLISHLFTEAHTIKAVEFLLSHGAEINGTCSMGLTPLHSAIIHQQPKTVALLLKHGADKLAKARVRSTQVKTAIQMAEARLANASGRTEIAQYQRIVKELTGNVAKKKASNRKRISPDLKAEIERFRDWHQANLLRGAPREIKLKPIRKSQLAKHINFKEWKKCLLELGFRHAGDYVSSTDVKISAFTHASEAMDGVLSAGGALGDDLRCGIVAYAKNGTVYTIEDHEVHEDPAYAPSFIRRTELPEVSPDKLFAKAKGILGSRIIRSKDIDASTFASRYEALFERMLDEFHTRVEKVLNTPVVMVRGKPARFERVGYHLDTTDWDEYEHTTKTMAEFSMDQLRDHVENLGKPKSNAWAAVRQAKNLLEMQHYQFVGAPRGKKHLELGLTAAQYALKYPNRGVTWTDDVLDAISYGCLFAMLLRKWGDVTVLCELLKPEFAKAKSGYSDDPTAELAAFVLVMASNYRERAFRNIDKYTDLITAGRPKQPKLLLRAWQAIQRHDQSNYQDAIRKLLERPKPWAVYRSAKLAVMESVVYLIGDEVGMSRPDLRLELEDRVCTRESIGLK